MCGAPMHAACEYEGENTADRPQSFNRGLFNEIGISTCNSKIRITGKPLVILYRSYYNESPTRLQLLGSVLLKIIEAYYDYHISAA